MLRRVACSLFLVGSVLYACKGSDPLPPAAQEPTNPQPVDNVSGGGGVANEDGSATTTDEGGILTSDGATTQCTAITLAGVVVDEEGTSGQAPNGQGGTIANGLYNLTQVAKYVGTGGIGVGPTGVTYQETIQITNGNTFERVRILASTSAVGSEERSIGVMVPVSPNLSITESCPLQQSLQYAYTATETSIVLITGAGTATGEQYTYTKQL